MNGINDVVFKAHARDRRIAFLCRIGIVVPVAKRFDVVVVDIDIAHLNERLVGTVNPPQNHAERLAVVGAQVVVVDFNVVRRLGNLRGPPGRTDNAARVAVGGEDVYRIVTCLHRTARDADVLAVHKTDTVAVAETPIMDGHIFNQTMVGIERHHRIGMVVGNLNIGDLKAVDTEEADGTDA